MPVLGFSPLALLIASTFALPSTRPTGQHEFPTPAVYTNLSHSDFLSLRHRYNHGQQQIVAREVTPEDMLDLRGHFDKTCQIYGEKLRFSKGWCEKNPRKGRGEGKWFSHVARFECHDSFFPKKSEERFLNRHTWRCFKGQECKDGYVTNALGQENVKISYCQALVVVDTPKPGTLYYTATFGKWSRTVEKKRLEAIRTSSTSHKTKNPLIPATRPWLAHSAVSDHNSPELEMLDTGPPATQSSKGHPAADHSSPDHSSPDHSSTDHSSTDHSSTDHSSPELEILDTWPPATQPSTGHPVADHSPPEPQMLDHAPENPQMPDDGVQDLDADMLDDWPPSIHIPDPEMAIDEGFHSHAMSPGERSWYVEAAEDVVRQHKFNLHYRFVYNDFHVEGEGTSLICIDCPWGEGAKLYISHYGGPASAYVVDA